ncbi:MAG: hypothetical protein K5Q00_00565 [Gammaproteobacteria bacterium]|nr:hypothetical protein [Gammaproteobacteria bacterium]
MLKKLYPFFVGALALSSITSAYADDVCKYVPGIVTCGSGTVTNVIGNGLVQLNGTTVTGAVITNGSLIAKNAILNKVKANGSSSLTNTKVSGASYFNGLLNSVGSSFLQPLTLGSGNSTLDSTSTTDITVTASKPPIQQKLTLQNASKVMGSITFQQGNGLVNLSSDSSISGKVNGGKIAQ